MVILLRSFVQFRHKTNFEQKKQSKIQAKMKKSNINATNPLNKHLNIRKKSIRPLNLDF
jgi:hypothetical protein